MHAGIVVSGPFFDFFLFCSLFFFDYQKTGDYGVD